jgi:hypothetical protein
MMRCSYFLWRFGKSSEGWLHFENSGSFIIFISWLVYVFMTNHFVDYFDKGSVTLIDLLFGVPIIIAMGLVFTIVWKGLVRGLLCMTGRLVDYDEN